MPILEPKDTSLNEAIKCPPLVELVVSGEKR